MFDDEIIGVLGPLRKIDIVNPGLLLGDSEVILLNIEETLGKVEEFWGEFSNI